MEHPKPSSQKEQKSYNSFLKYTSLGLQMVITIGIAGWLGHLLDNKLQFQFPLFLLSFVLIALVGSLYLLIKNLPKE